MIQSQGKVVVNRNQCKDGLGKNNWNKKQDKDSPQRKKYQFSYAYYASS